MRWWRRNDGFDWNEYVRTTILVRRQQRRDKIEAARAAAIEGVKDAGRKGLAAGAAGAEAAQVVAVKIARAAADRAAGGAEKGLALLLRSAAAARSRIAVASEPVNTRLSSSRASLSLAAVTLLAGAGFAVRAGQFGVDRDAVLLGIAALLAGVLWSWPRVFSNGPAADEEWAVRTERAVVLADRASSYAPAAAAAILGGVGLWFALPLASEWLQSAPTPAAGKAGAETAAETSADVVKGTARVAGPGLLRIRQTLVQLDGVTMLDPGQSCRRDDGTTWPCGAAARQALEKLVRSRGQVTCTITGEREGAKVGTCSAGGRDLGAEMARAGHGFADGTFFSSYSEEEREARDAKAGLWAGEPERPENWRERLFAEAAVTAPGGCPIKGRVQSGRKIYVLPHSAEYARIGVREDRGERWFCTIVDAKAAGFAARDGK